MIWVSMVPFRETATRIGVTARVKAATRPARFSERAGDNEIDEGDRADPRKGLRKDEDPAFKTKHCCKGSLDPESDRRFIHGHKSRRIKGIEEPAAGLTSVLFTAAA